VLFTSFKVAALKSDNFDAWISFPIGSAKFAEAHVFRHPGCPWFRQRNPVPLQPMKNARVIFAGSLMEEIRMKKTLAVLATVATVAATTVSAPAEARGRGIGPGLAFGLAAGALAAGAAASAYPYYYGPGYGYYDYGPTYYYGPGPYAYYGGPYYRRHRHWHHYW
jgi:hypothetical protein